MKYFVIGPFEDGMFYVAYRYDFCAVAVPVMQFTCESAAARECTRMNDCNPDCYVEPETTDSP